MSNAEGGGGGVDGCGGGNKGSYVVGIGMSLSLSYIVPPGDVIGISSDKLELVSD